MLQLTKVMAVQAFGAVLLELKVVVGTMILVAMALLKVRFLILKSPIIEMLS
jgi:hypothetical protein